MGKNKGSGKKLSVFKVAGAKSLKAKSKAKPVKGNLKKNYVLFIKKASIRGFFLDSRLARTSDYFGNYITAASINEIVRKNISKIDKDLASFPIDIRKRKEEKRKSNSNQKNTNRGNEPQKSPQELEKEKQATLEKLEKMEF